MDGKLLPNSLGIIAGQKPVGQIWIIGRCHVIKVVGAESCWLLYGDSHESRTKGLIPQEKNKSVIMKKVLRFPDSPQIIHLTYFVANIFSSKKIGLCLRLSLMALELRMAEWPRCFCIG